ncbi:MAG: hypothetical protein ABJ320_18915 [Lentilitoribacter sp.]|uniref:hypothetical protein n=1 Tax=Tateyamaria sp. TaxID=1929288 RepID=UPI003288D8C1
MDQKQRLTTLVYEASNLRDYLMHVQGEDSGDLAQALSLFDRSDDFSAIADADVLALRDAFQTAYDRLCLRIDTYTIGEVLHGKSPVGRGTPILTSLLLCLAGFLLVAAVFNFTYWANRASVAVAEAQEFLEFDHSSEIARLVEMKILFDKVASDVGTDNLEPQLMYLEGISTLQQHYSRETELMSRMHGLWDEARVYRAPGEFLTNWVCSKAGDSGVLNVAIDSVFGCPEKAVIQQPSNEEAQVSNAEGTQLSRSENSQAPTTDVDQLTGDELTQLARSEGTQGWDLGGVVGMVDTQETFDAILTPSVFDKRFTAVKNAQFETMERANRRAVSFYQDTLDAVSVRIKDLREWLNTIHLWALPILYGMLGSVVYCMWRVLNPSVAPLGFFYSFMRTIFAGLAAMTLSMLLVPSNILTAGVELNRPLIYLLSFVFGYSVEVFINTLNLFNTYFLANLTVRPRKDAK